jgi:hypothetical protein
VRKIEGITGIDGKKGTKERENPSRKECPNRADSFIDLFPNAVLLSSIILGIYLSVSATFFHVWLTLLP